VAIGNEPVLEESNRLGNQIVVGVADSFNPANFPIGSLPRSQTRRSMFGASLT